jgi:N-dimethylarginine dimethylaminohydrolase
MKKQQLLLPESTLQVRVKNTIKLAEDSVKHRAHLLQERGANMTLTEPLPYWPGQTFAQRHGFRIYVPHYPIIKWWKI